jgi:hypothetical protein
VRLMYIRHLDHCLDYLEGRNETVAATFPCIRCKKPLSKGHSSSICVRCADPQHPGFAKGIWQD